MDGQSGVLLEAPEGEITMQSSYDISLISDGGVSHLKAISGEKKLNSYAYRKGIAQHNHPGSFIRDSPLFLRSAYIIWASSSAKVPSSMRKMYGFTSSCTCAVYHPVL